MFFVALGPRVLPDYGKIPQVILVSVTTLHEGLPNDPACVLDAGEHPFIKHKSYIAYRHARIEPAPHVEHLIGSVWPTQPDCDKNLLDRIISGIVESRMTPRHIKQAIQGR
ncbi:MAG: hypothetical protein LBI87_12465 [Candidatus Accumulibacter sp.]|nr:hypothetical protein [Accumulibacter sp.]